MEYLDQLTTGALRFGPLLAALAGVTVVLMLVNWFLRRRWKDKPDAQFHFQLIMLALTLAGGLAIIVALPVSDALRGQLLSLIGIVLSAAIALSSTTFIGNIMAGVMLKAIRSVRPGDFITVADIVGRVTEMDLLHTEIQTEDRDLVTIPNLYVVTHPMRVVRASGTIVSAEVSLGYDVPRQDVKTLLKTAAEQAGLKDCFVQIRALGDFSVVYRVAGMLEDVKSLISARSNLRENMLDALHGAGIEIVSPNFMNTRAIAEGRVFVPEVHAEATPDPAVKPEDLAFDKAEQAASIDDIRKEIEVVDAQMAELDKSKGEENGAAQGQLTARRASLLVQLETAEAQRKAAESEELTGSGK